MEGIDNDETFTEDDLNNIVWFASRQDGVGTQTGPCNPQSRRRVVKRWVTYHSAPANTVIDKPMFITASDNKVHAGNIY